VNVVIRIKRIATVALLAALCVFGVLAALPYTVPRHDMRQAVMRSLVAATGVTPDIGGAHFGLFPRPSVRFNDVRFDGGGKDDLSAGSLRATVKLLPLLFGRVEVATLTFQQAHLNIDAGPNGVRLLGLPLRPLSVAAEMSDFPEIRIADSIVDIRSADGERSERFLKVGASLAWSGESLSTLATFEWRGMPSTLSVQIADSGALGENAKSAVRLRFETDSLRAGFEGNFAFRKGLQAEGALSLDSRSLRTLLAAFGIEVPTRGGFGSFSLKSRAQITPAALTTSNLSIELDGNRADGTMSLAIDGKRPVLQGTLAADTADFSTYMSGFSLVTADKRDWSREPLDIKPLSGFDLDLRLSAGKIIFGKAEALKVALAASVKEGRFTLSAGEGQIFGGILRGTAAIGPAAGGAGVRIDANIQNFNSAQGVGAFTGNRNLEGTGSLTLSLAGVGASVNAITHDLKGQAELSVLNGALQGVNVEGALRTLSKKPLAVLSDFSGGRTPFDRFIAKLAINDGNAAFEQGRIESGSVAVTLDGLASIPERDLNLRGVASLVVPQGANGVSLPFFVRGRWDSPRFSPDSAAWLRHSSLRPELRAALP
jgi:AsmA protein